VEPVISSFDEAAREYFKLYNHLLVLGYSREEALKHLADLVFGQTNEE
jgi:hypothetical protein